MEAKLKDVKITKRFCTGEYEFEEFTATIEVDSDAEEGDVARIIRETKREFVEGQKEIEEEEKNGKSKTNSSKNNDKNGKGPGKKNAGSNDEGSENNEASNTETSDNDNDQSQGNEDSSREEQGQENDEDQGEKSKGKNSSKGKKESKVEGKEGKKSFKRKPQHYDRSIEQHKEIFSGVMTALVPDWRDDPETKKKAKKVSENVEGEPFLDENGEVLADFKTKVRKQMK